MLKFNKKFFLLVSILILFIIFFSYEIILKNSFEKIISNLTERKTTYEKIYLDFKKSELKFYKFKIHNKENFSYNYLFDCEEIIIKFNIKSFFSDTFISLNYRSLGSYKHSAYNQPLFRKY